MAARDVLVVALRVLGLWFLVLAIDALPALVAEVWTLCRPIGIPGAVVNPTPWTLAGMCVPFLRGGLGIVLLVCASRIALRFYPKTQDEAGQETPGRVGPGDLYRIASYVLGVCVLLQAVEPATRTLVLVIHRDVGSTLHVELAEACVMLVLGIGLIFGAGGIATFFERLRYDPNRVPTQQLSIPLMLLIILICALLVGIVRYLAL